jgi:hypothetical protein
MALLLTEASKPVASHLDLYRSDDRRVSAEAQYAPGVVDMKFFAGKIEARTNLRLKTTMES